MLFKFNVSNVVITNTYAQKDVTESTTVNIDNVSIEQEVKPEEVKELLNSLVNVAKELRIAKRRNTRPAKRYHVCKYNNAGYWNCKRFSMYYIVQDRTSKNLYLKYIFDDADSLTRELPLEKLSVYNKKKYIVAEYDCDNFKL